MLGVESLLAVGSIVAVFLTPITKDNKKLTVATCFSSIQTFDECKNPAYRKSYCALYKPTKGERRNYDHSQGCQTERFVRKMVAKLTTIKSEAQVTSGAGKTPIRLFSVQNEPDDPIYGTVGLDDDEDHQEIALTNIKLSVRNSLNQKLKLNGTSMTIGIECPRARTGKDKFDCSEKTRSFNCEFDGVQLKDERHVEYCNKLNHHFGNWEFKDVQAQA